jgi:glyoxylase-like metal-dependent hydrolase (beta-lactamase superfamily II)
MTRDPGRQEEPYRRPAERVTPANWRVGDITCRLFDDGWSAPLLPSAMFPAAEPTDLQSSVVGRTEPDGRLRTQYRCLLLTTAAGIVLVDTGYGHDRPQPPVGRTGLLLGGLAAAGVAADDIDIVVLSHAHADHIGGLIHRGALTFPRARHVMLRQEWEHWTSDTALSAMPDRMAAPARATLPRLAASGLLDVVEGACTITDGVQLVPAPGHTPGHCAVTISSNGENTLFLGDAVYDPVQFAHPEWSGVVDTDRDIAAHTRRRLLDAVSGSGSLVVGYHLATTGQVDGLGDAFAWIIPGADAGTPA